MKTSTIILSILSLVISQGDLAYGPTSGTIQGAGAFDSEAKPQEEKSSELPGKFGLEGSANSQVSGLASYGDGSASTDNTANIQDSGSVSDEHGDDNTKKPSKLLKSGSESAEYEDDNNKNPDELMDFAADSAEKVSNGNRISLDHLAFDSPSDVNGKDKTMINKPETSENLGSAKAGSLNDKKCETGSSEDCDKGQSSDQKKGPVLKKDETALAKIDVPVAVDEKTKQENLSATSTIQIFQKKLETGQVTYEERSDDGTVEGHLTINFESIDEIEAIYAHEEIKGSNKEDQNTMKEAELVTCISKVLSESKQFNFKGQEIIKVGIQVKKTNSGQIEEAQNKGEGVNQNESNSDTVIYREHKVAIVKSDSGAAQLESKPNCVDISKSEDKNSVTQLFHQVEQTEYQFAENIQLFIKQNSDGKNKTTQAGLLAQQLESQCSSQQQGENKTQACLVEYVENQLVIYDSSLVTTEIKSTEEAVKNNDKLSYPETSCSGCSKNNQVTFPKSKEFGITKENPIPNKKNSKVPTDKNSGDSLDGNSGTDDPRNPVDPLKSGSDSDYQDKEGAFNADLKSKNSKLNNPETISDPSGSGADDKSALSKPSEKRDNRNKCDYGTEGDCNSLPVGPPGGGSILKESSTSLSNITVAVAVNKKTKKEDLVLTSIVQIVQKKFETNLITYEEGKKWNSNKGHVAIYFKTVEELEAIYTTQELKHVNKEEKATFKEAAFVSVVGKILVDSKRFDFKQQESVFVSIKVKNNSATQSQYSPVSENAIDQHESSGNGGALYISRTHQVALVKSESKVAQLEKDVNHIDISNPQDKQAVNCLFQQVDQTRVQYVEKIQSFIKENVNSNKGTEETTMLARQMKAVCADQIKENSRLQVCLMEYVEKKVIIYDSKLVNTEIKSTEKAVKDNDKLQYNKDCSDCSNGSIATFPMSKKYNISEDKPVPTRQEIKNKQRASTSDNTGSQGQIATFSKKNQNYNGQPGSSLSSQGDEDGGFFNNIFKNFGMTGSRDFNMDNFKNFFEANSDFF